MPPQACRCRCGMRLRLVTTLSLAALAAALVCTGGAGAGSGGALAVGIASDEPFVANNGGSSYYGALRDMGMTTSRLVVVWHPESPNTIYDRPELDQLIPTALGYGITP